MNRNHFQFSHYDPDFLHAQWVGLTSRYASDPSAIESLFNYRKGRMKVLNDFLDRENIYQTEEIGAKYETQARHNIAEEMRALSDKSLWK
jgi:hypothetical protein